MEGKLAYIVSRFPHLPETFILREMAELTQQGWEIALYPLIRQEQAVMHAEAREWMEQARYSPMLSLAVGKANVDAFWQQPAELMTLWRDTIRGNAGDTGFLLRATALLPLAVKFARHMQEEGVEHIHAHYATHPALVAWMIHRLTGIPYSVTVHAHDIFVSKAMLEVKLREADFVVAISEYNRDFLSRTLGSWIMDKTHVIHCGIDPDLYRPNRLKRVRGQQFEILNIGSLQAYKGHSFLIEACARLQERRIPFRCRIIGGGSQADLKRLINQRGLDAKVELLGPLDQSMVPQYLSRADCYVQPSVVTPSGKMEGIPVSLMEAMASRVPVVATNISGIPELVQPGKTGYLVPAADADALADAVWEIYNHPEKADSLAEAGRLLVNRDFNLRTNVRRLGDLFQGYIGSGTEVVEAVPYAAPSL